MIGRPPVRPEIRFWAKVDKTETCWLWTASLNRYGYGQFSISHTKMVGAHRFSYELANGEIPAGLHLDHLCRTRHCVNPAHLEPVPVEVNILRGTGYAARNAVKTHCPRGHVYDQANTRITPAGARACRACGRARHQNKEP